MTSAANLDAEVSTLLAKQEITEVLYRRARAGDRRDVDLALRCYHPGATEEHEAVDTSMTPDEAHQHQRRADKFSYLERKLAERKRSERGDENSD